MHATTPITSPVRVGIVGTGFAAKLRAQALLQDSRCHLVAVAGRDQQRTKDFIDRVGLTPYPPPAAVSSWQELLNHDIDLVIISTVNPEHGPAARAALLAHKHVVVEYPLALHVPLAEEIIQIAEAKQLLLHIEHIELLGGVHQALKQNLPKVGNVTYARYTTISPQHPAPHKWTYHREDFGFPLTAALSRVHRLTDLFGPVIKIKCDCQYWAPPENPDYFIACLCAAQLELASGFMAHLVYGKGENFWKPERRFEVHGHQGSLIFDGDMGELVTAKGNEAIEVGDRRGLFAKDTTMVIDHLTTGQPLYLQPADSLYSLKIAAAAQLSAQTGETVTIET
ncbi:MAG TPA: Gfo/Idh/MocA family oxidoreductase [Oscillatoriaceae cyanobacterium M33_DOE_052]|uniref:Gfo/Idh/MocA family oxidoreductase n=1 Tax=Planktothricoides sp. SpSt-374 TaxID=2282167 RepID=A0A7C3ZIT4_9CYAN|nr:Gfo/Idh/MocA family oxidoreductase [Oscillatoriaceae cyanobacterium M33_DOE_052]